MFVQQVIIEHLLCAKHYVAAKLPVGLITQHERQTGTSTQVVTATGKEV